MPINNFMNDNEKIIKAWGKFTNGESLKGNEIRKVILESWKRSRSYGVNPLSYGVSMRLSEEELKKRYKESSMLLKTTKPFMNSIYKIVENTDFIIRLTDKDGYVLAHIGEEKIVNRYFPMIAYDGYNVKEEFLGTTAIGIALISGEPIQVVGGEHYLKEYHKLSSSACPIKNYNDTIVGVLSITGSYDLVHPHTLGMVVAAAEAIEKEMELAEYNKELKSINERFSEITESISEGIIRVDNNGIIMSINRFARKLLSYSETSILGKHVKTILSPDNRGDILQGIIGGNINAEEEINFKTRNGRKKSCIANITPIRSAGGIVITLRETKMLHNLVNKIVGANAKFNFGDILGKSPAINEAIRLASLSANTNTTILLQGESGTGKEMFAQAIHNESDRSGYPFVFLNCGAIPRELVSSELFGYIEGAFTGAKRGGHPGKFELADGGTIFLDEIGDMPLDAQVSLLRVLEDKKIVRVGGHEVIPIDVRVIAATNKDLKKEVELGNFREDLFYRINVMPIYTPALRERKEDIRILIDYFGDLFSKKTNKAIKGIGPSFYKGMISYNWPGNVRELQNVMQRIINMADNNSTLTNKDIPSYITDKASEEDIKFSKKLVTLDDLEKSYIKKAIEECNGNIASASKVLGIGRTTMYRKMKKYNIEGL